MLTAVELAPPDRVVELAEQYRPSARDRPVEKSRRAARHGPGLIARFNEHVGVCEVLRREFGVPNAVSGRTIRCPLHDDRRASLSIARDDSRVWCHSPTCELHGPSGAGHDAYSLWCLAKSRASAG
jgi:hypothetical protein